MNFHCIFYRSTWMAGILACVVALAPFRVEALEEGKAAPQFEVTTLDGKIFKSSDARGEVVVVNFWASWCTFCREEMPALETYYQHHKSEGLQVVAISTDGPDEDGKVREIMRAYSYPASLGRMGDIRGFGRIWRLPMTFVIDRNGILRKDGSEGDPKVDLATLEKEVTPLLKAGAAQRRP